MSGRATSALRLLGPGLALGLALLLSACDSSAPVRAGSRPNVLLICLDTVRADHLGTYGYDEFPTTPHLDALADRSTVFLDTVATAGWTKPSVPSFLTGTYPAQHGVYEGSARRASGAWSSDVLGSELTTLAERFHAEGYDTAAFVRNAQLRAGQGFEQGFALYQDEAGDARRIRWQATDWLLDRGEDPWFLYLHLLDAHMPYDIPDDAATRFSGDADLTPFRGSAWRQTRDQLNDGERPLDDELAETLAELYAGSIRFMDEEIGQLLAHLARLELEQDTIVCVVADHGEEFLEHGRLGHGHGLWENLVQVGWILHVPGRPASREETPVGLVDLVPSLIAAAGLPVDETLPGVDRLAHPGLRRPRFSEHKAPDSYLQALTDGSHKLMRRFEPPPRALGEISALTAVQPGTRWKADVLAEPDGALRIARLRPDDNDLDDPLELKGVAVPTALGPRLLGLDLEVLEGAEFYGDGAPDRGPVSWAAERLVKVRATFADGHLVATKVKLYAADAEPEHELTGTVTARGSNHIEIGGLRLGLDGDTRVEGVDVEHDPMTRDDGAFVLEPGLDGALEAGFGVQWTVLDLGRDPGETEPLILLERPTSGEARRLDEALDALGRQLLARRSWGNGDGSTLDAESLDDLRALGYVR